MLKKLLIALICILPTVAFAQTLPKDTILNQPSTAVTPQWRSFMWGGKVQLQAGINGKYLFVPTYQFLTAANNIWNGDQTWNGFNNTFVNGLIVGEYPSNGSFSSSGISASNGTGGSFNLSTFGTLNLNRTGASMGLVLNPGGNNYINSSAPVEFIQPVIHQGIASLPDEFVTLKELSSHGSVAGSGLTKTDSVISLGGTLTQPWTEDITGQTVTFLDNTGGSPKSLFQQNSQSVNIAAVDPTGNIYANGVNNNNKEAVVTRTLQSPTLKQGAIGVNASGNFVRDDFYQQGLKAVGLYEANYTDSNYVTKRYVSSVLSSKPDSASIANKYQTKIFINVADYGVKADSLTDNLTALRALASNPITNHATIYFPGGKGTLISDSVVWQYPVKLLGAGGRAPYVGTGGTAPTTGLYKGGNSIIVQTGANKTGFVINRDGSTVDGLTIKNTGGTPTAGEGIRIQHGNMFSMTNTYVGDFYTNVHIVDGLDMMFHHNQFTNPIAYNVLMEGTNDDEGNNEFSYNIFNASVSGTATSFKGTYVAGLRFDGNDMHIASGQYGPMPYGTSWVKYAIDISCKSNTSALQIRNNLIEAYQLSAIRIKIDPSTPSVVLNKILIENNILSNSGNGAARDLEIVAPTLPQIRGVNVLGNHISTSGPNASIYMENVGGVNMMGNQFGNNTLPRRDSLVNCTNVVSIVGSELWADKGISGGNQVGSSLKLKATTGNGTSTGIGVQLLGGNNGATPLLTGLNNGNVGVGSITNPGASLEIPGALLLQNNQFYRGKNTTGGAVSLLGYNASNQTVLGPNSEIMIAGTVNVTPATGGTIVLTSGVADGATAVGMRSNTSVTYTTAGAKLYQWRNSNVEKAFIDKDGLFNSAAATASTPAGWDANKNLVSLPAGTYALSADSANNQNIINASRLAFNGDSFTAGQGSFDNTFPSQTASLTKLTPYNAGVAGTNSTQILAAITAAPSRLGYSQVLWSGRNDITQGVAQTTIQNNIASSVAAFGHTRYLVIGILPDNSEAVGSANYTKLAAVNSNSASVYGVRYINALAVLQAHGDGSANDNADIAAGRVPRSLQSDALHLNAAGYGWIAAAVNSKINYITDPSTKYVQVRNGAANSPYADDQFSIPTRGKYLIGGQQALFIPNQSTASGTMVVGDAGKNVSLSSGSTYVGLNNSPNVTGNLNTIIGNFAAFNGSTMSQNTVVGYTAGANSSGNYNWSDFFGVQAGNNATSTYGSMALGYFSQLPLNGSTNYQMSIKNAIYGNDMDGQNATISTGNIGLFVKQPLARLHLPAGTATANKAPFKFSTGVASQATVEQGAVNWDGTRITVGSGGTPVNQTVAYLSDLSPAVVVSSAATLTLAYGTDYVFTGSTSTFTLPAVNSTNNTRKDFITIKNRGTGNITVNGTIYDGSAVGTISVAAGSAVTFVMDGTYHNRE